MAFELVSFDLETTGFDPVRDEIIEIGAVRTRDGEVLDTFSTFVNPGRTIPEAIRQLTGIEDRDVIGAPRLAEVLPTFAEFVGERPLIAHNIAFDAGFMYQRGVLRSNARTDTFDLAMLLLPTAPRYSLGALAAHLGVSMGSAHRALNDALAAAEIFWHLYRRLLALPPNLLLEIHALAGHLNWDGRYALEQAMSERGLRPGPFVRVPLPFTPDSRGEPRREQAAGSPQAAEVDQVLLHALPAVLPAYEVRPQQQAMAHRVLDALNQGEQVMIEAGTGTGKSIGYLTPAALYAARTGERVVLATNTIALQEQLLTHDWPMLAAALDAPVSLALLKGRSNYLCPRRFEQVRLQQPASVEDLRLMVKLLVWMQDSASGDRGEITLRHEDGLLWSRISAEDRGCTPRTCEMLQQGACPFHKARRAAEAAQLVVVNHALLVSDAMAERHVLPPYRHVVIDEAHQFEDAVTSGMSTKQEEAPLRRRLHELTAPRFGLLNRLQASLHAGAPAKESGRLDAYLAQLADAVGLMAQHVVRVFAAARDFALRQEAGGEGLVTLRLVPKLRKSSGFQALAAAYEPLDEFLDTLVGALGQVRRACTRLEPHGLPDFEAIMSDLDGEIDFFASTHEQLRRWIREPDENEIYWLVSARDQPIAALHAAPLHVGRLCQEVLWQQKAGVVLTSATLQSEHSFAYLQSRLSAEHFATLDVGTPFDYVSSTLLYLPNDLPGQDDRNKQQQAIERSIIELAVALGGRTMCLFTSYAQLRQTAAAISGRLRLGGITVFDQSDGVSRQSLLDSFRHTTNSVLLGTRTFWEGVDIPGEALSALVIVKLPFAVPTDPIVAARTETYSNAFYDYSVPDAVIRFRQGFGRLIRTRTDRGVVVVLDGRILTARYGERFLASLPECTIQMGSIRDLASAARQWINPEPALE